MTTSSELVHERTPPHHPTHGVRLSDGEIKAIIFDVLHDEVETIEQLPSGRSFNNRIYFIRLSARQINVVLKIPGWNFGADKIQNETINLLLLEKHSPRIPVPRAFGWSEGDGKTCEVCRCIPSPGDDIQVDDGIPPSDTRIITRESRNLQKWILMSHLPGHTLQPSQIEEPHDINSIMKQLAEYMSQWRRVPAPTSQIGNLQFVGENHTSPDDILFGLRIVVHGLLIGSASSAIRSSREYYATKIRGELAILKDNENYAPNRASLVPIVDELLQDILPNTELVRHSAISVFTHYDLSPRNILVSLDTSGKLEISGIVDFEFAGFFPAEEEFTNTSIIGEGDWPLGAWMSFIKHLQACGVEVPRGEVWVQACALVRIIDNIAPWRLRESGVKGEALDAALEQAGVTVRENAQLLKQALVSGHG